MDLLADRFLVCDRDTTIDLASGERVQLIVSASGGVADQTRWAMRCDRFARLRHRSIAPLLDYGPLGEVHRFEAWRSDGRWRGSLHEGDRVRRHVEEFFCANGWESGAIDIRSVHQVNGRAMLLPDARAGVDRTDHDHKVHETERLSSVAVLGLTEVADQRVAAMADIFNDRVGAPCTVVALHGDRGSGHDNAVLNLARAARLRGYVPVASHLIQRDLRTVLQGRSVALFIRSTCGNGWSAVLSLSLMSHKPHIAVFVGPHCPRGVAHITLSRMSAKRLELAVVPGLGLVQFRKQIARAARRAKGLPGRFEALIWGERDMPESFDQAKHSRVAESAAPYSRETAAIAPLEPSGRVVEWPGPGELANLRRRLHSAMALAHAGRHAAADRTLRQVSASFARRHDWEHAAEARLALASSLLRRGRPAEAQSLLAETRDATGRNDQHPLLNRIAILTGTALIDDGRVEEGEGVLTAAVAAARGLEERVCHRMATLALARCLFWRGRFGEAVDSLNEVDVHDLCDEEAVRFDVMGSRVAVGQRDFEGAITQAAGALDRAQKISHPGLIASSACAAAFAHLAVGDHAAVAHDAALAVQMARRAHDPLLGWRARLLAAESHRRQGRRATAQVLCTRMRRLTSSPLPPILRARADLLNALAGSGGQDEDILVKRLVQTLGLAGLALFAPVQQAISHHAATVADVVSILQCCQMADEETRVLEELCSRLKIRFQAAGASFLVEEGGTFTPVASDGAGFEASLAQRAAALDHPIAPHQLNGRVVAGASVRYGGRSLGVLLVRWGLGSAYNPPEAAMLLATAATAAGPAMAGVLARRASAVAPRIPELIGLSPLMVDVRRAIERSAAAPFAVLVEGESGTGKELVARAIHRQSTRRDRPFCTLNCAALPDDLVESELFGHSRGAFTGALAERAGVFEEAHTGTLFLDEIGELSPRAQAKVLRTVQEGELRRVGENVPRRIDVRLVAATNRDLRQEVAAGRFRLDLLYRLDVIRISLPPLRARRDDVPLLAEHFWRDAAARIGSRATLSMATLAELARYDWPGNVRELQNVLAALAVRTPRRGLVPPSALPPNFGAVETRLSSRLDAARRIFDTQFVRAALARAGGHRIRAAQELGVTRQGLTKLMNRLGLNERLSPQP